MSDLEWWCRGDAGETVLANVEHYLINQNHPIGFARWAMEFGLSKDAIIKIIDDEYAKSASELSQSTNKQETCK